MKSLQKAEAYLEPKQVSTIFANLFKGAHIKYVGEGGWRVLQIFQKNFRSPGNHRPKYFMDPPINFSFLFKAYL